MPTNSSALIVPAPSTNGASNAAVELTLRDIKAPVGIPDYWFWIWLTLALAALVVGGYFLWKYWLRDKLKTPPPPPLPPHARARRRLREVMALINDFQAFTVAVSDIIRVYLEEQFNLHAPDRTTEEFLYELQGSRQLGEEPQRLLGEFLNRCDLVKFAQYEPTRMELEDLHNAAMRLIEETEPKPTLTTPQDPSGNNPQLPPSAPPARTEQKDASAGNQPSAKETTASP